jgi:hypothetical protein
MEDKHMGILPPQKIDMVGGKYRIRQVAQWQHIQTAVEEEDQNGYRLISFAGDHTMSGNFYYLLFEKVEKRKTRAEIFQQDVKNQQP